MLCRFVVYMPHRGSVLLVGEDFNSISVVGPSQAITVYRAEENSIFIGFFAVIINVQLEFSTITRVGRSWPLGWRYHRLLVGGWTMLKVLEFRREQ